MRLTKGMKKVLSMTLAGALVVTGLGIPGQGSDAATEKELTWEGTLHARANGNAGTDGKSGSIAETTGGNLVGEEADEDLVLSSSVWAAGATDGYAGANMTGTFDLSDFEEPYVEVTATNEEESEQNIEVAFGYKVVHETWGDNNKWLKSKNLKVATGTGMTVETKIDPSDIDDPDKQGVDADGQFVAVAPPVKKKVTITKIRIYDKAYEAPAPTEPEPTADANAVEFKAELLGHLTKVWNVDDDTEITEAVTINRNGEFWLEAGPFLADAEDLEDDASAPAYANLPNVWIDTTLKNGDVPADFKMEVTEIQIGNDVWTFENPDPGLLCFKNQDAVDEDGNPGTYRYNIRNEYNKLYDAATHQLPIAATTADIFGGKTVRVPNYSTIKVKLVVSGNDSTKEKKTYSQVEDKNADSTETRDGAYGSSESTVVEGALPTALPTAIPTTPAEETSTSPSAAPTSGSTATPTATAPGAKTATATPAPGAKTATATPTAAPKTTATKVKCTKVKAAKKTYTIKKKGKTTKVVFKLTTSPKNKKTAEKVSFKFSKKKIAKVTKKKLAAKKLTVTVKGLKKGKTVLTAKVGSKSGKATIKVKK